MCAHVQGSNPWGTVVIVSQGLRAGAAPAFVGFHQDAQPREVCGAWELLYQPPLCASSSSELSPKHSYLPEWQSPIESHLFQRGTRIYLLHSFSH